MMEDFTCAFGTDGGKDGRMGGRAGRQAGRFFASAECKNEKIQIHEILVIITFSSKECLFKPAQMSRLARADVVAYTKYART